MKCWQTFDFEKSYGFNKIIISSTLVILSVFSFIFALMQSFSKEVIVDSHFSWFLAGAIAVYPLHKVIHILPVLRLLPYMRLNCQMKYAFMPILSIQTNRFISKKRFIVMLLLPFLTVTPVLLAAGAVFPQYMHYYTMLAALHTGICAMDFLYLKGLAASPGHAVIEETEAGYEILVPFQ